MSAAVVNVLQSTAAKLLQLLAAEEYDDLFVLIWPLKNSPFHEELWPEVSKILKAGVVKPSSVINIQEQKNHQNLSENRIPNAK